jgi:hypothetical protein
MLELQQRAFILKLGVVMKKTIVTSHSYHFKKMTTELTVMHLHHCVKIAYRPPAGRDGPPPPPHLAHRLQFGECPGHPRDVEGDRVPEASQYPFRFRLR